MSLKYFTDSEVFGLVPEIAERLDVARGYAGFPIAIPPNSVRTEEQNQEIKGASPNSSHLRGQAVDLHRPTGEFECLKLVWALGRAGFRRVLIYTKHIHVDVDPSKTQDICIWMGDSH